MLPTIGGPESSQGVVEVVHDLPDSDSVTTSGGTSGAKRARPADDGEAAAPAAAGAHVQNALHTGQQVAPQQVPTMLPPSQYAYGMYYPPAAPFAGPSGAPLPATGANFAPPSYTVDTLTIIHTIPPKPRRVYHSRANREWA